MDDMEATFLLLKKYIEKVDANEFLRDHDARFSDLRDQVEEKANNLPPPLNVISKRLYKIADNTFFCIELFNYKFYFLVKGIVHALETENPLSLANNTRSLLEQMSVFVHCITSIKQMLESLKNQGKKLAK